MKGSGPCRMRRILKGEDRTSPGEWAMSGMSRGGNLEDMWEGKPGQMLKNFTQHFTEIS